MLQMLTLLYVIIKRGILSEFMCISGAPHTTGIVRDGILITGQSARYIYAVLTVRARGFCPSCLQALLAIVRASRSLCMAI